MIFGGFQPERGWAPNGTMRGFSRRATAQAPTVGFSGSAQAAWAGRAVESPAFFPSCREGRGVHCMGAWIHIQDLFEQRPPLAGFGGRTPMPRLWRPPVSAMIPPVMKGRKRRVVALRTVPRMARCACPTTRPRVGCLSPSWSVPWRIGTWASAGSPHYLSGDD